MLLTTTFTITYNTTNVTNFTILLDRKQNKGKIKYIKIIKFDNIKIEYIDNKQKKISYLLIKLRLLQLLYKINKKNTYKLLKIILIQCQ